MMGHSDSMAVEHNLNYIQCKLHSYSIYVQIQMHLKLTHMHESVVGAFYTPGVTHYNVMCSELIKITSKPYQLGSVCMYINYTQT